MQGHTLSEARQVVDAEIESRRQNWIHWHKSWLKQVAHFGRTRKRHERLIVRGRSIFWQQAEGRAFRIKELLDDLERKRDIADFLELTQQGDGVRIFIGSENKLSLSGSSLVVSGI